jgi:hypothetical protein
VRVILGRDRQNCHRRIRAGLFKQVNAGIYMLGAPEWIGRLEQAYSVKSFALSFQPPDRMLDDGERRGSIFGQFRRPEERNIEPAFEPDSRDLFIIRAEYYSREAPGGERRFRAVLKKRLAA